MGQVISREDTVFMFDMDETVYNLTKEVIKWYNKDFNDNFNWKDNKEYFWDSTPKGNRDYFANLLVDDTKRVFRNGQPIKGMVEFINELVSKGYRVYFVTNPEKKGQAYQDKIAWLEDNFRWFDKNKHFIATAKKELLARPNRVLVDDYPEYLNNWSRNGGISIGFGDNNWTREFNGYKVKDANELRELIKIAEMWKE